MFVLTYIGLESIIIILTDYSLYGAKKRCKGGKMSKCLKNQVDTIFLREEGKNV